METITELKVKEKEIIEIKKLINYFEDLYEIEEWTLQDLDEFRIIGTEIVDILKLIIY